MVVGTQETCPHCPPWMKTVQKQMPRKVAIVEVPSNNGRAECEAVQNALKVKFTPQTFLYQNGRLIEKFEPVSDKNAENVRALKALIAKHQGKNT